MILGVGSGLNTPSTVVSSPALAARHKFFDSVPQPAGRPTVPLRPSTAVLTTASQLPRPITPVFSGRKLERSHVEGRKPDVTQEKEHYGSEADAEPRDIPVPAENVVHSAHYGYIYCMSLVRDDNGTDVRLVTGSGDEDTKVRITCRFDFAN